MSKTKGKELELLLAILPDNNGSLYGRLYVSTVKSDLIYDRELTLLLLYISILQVISSEYVKLISV